MRKLLIACLIAIAILHPADAQPTRRDWNTVLSAADGQTVYWHAWGGSTRINAFIGWAGKEVEARYGVKVVHVKLADTADAVSRVIAEKASGRDSDGAVDLVWINGENFASMKTNGLLYGPWAEDLPNWAFVDVEGKPAVTRDFTIPTEGLEAPWSMAQVVFYYDSARLPQPPKSIRDLRRWLVANPGRFTFPQPPDFLGSTFLKQALYGLSDDAAVLLRPATEANYETVTAPLWVFLSDVTPHLWRAGRAYPQNGPRQIQLMADGEIDLAISFSPGEASAAIANGELPATVRTYVLDGGTLGNANFVAIPYNARAKAGAMVLTNFLLSPEAQARKQHPEVWGSGTVLALDKLLPQDRERFTNLRLGVATLSPEQLGPALPEPHPSWMTRIEADWVRRFGVTR